MSSVVACRSRMSKILKIFFGRDLETWEVWTAMTVFCHLKQTGRLCKHSNKQGKKKVFKRFLKWPWEVWTALNSPVCEWRHGRLGLDALTRPWPGQGYTNTKTGWAEIQVSTNTNTNTDSRVCKALTWPRLCKYKHRNQKYKYPLIRKQTTKSSARQSTTWPRLHKHKDRLSRNTSIY